MLAVVAHNLYVVSETGPKGKPKGGKLLPLALFLAFLVPSLVYYQYQKCVLLHMV